MNYIEYVNFNNSRNKRLAKLYGIKDYFKNTEINPDVDNDINELLEAQTNNARKRGIIDKQEPLPSGYAFKHHKDKSLQAIRDNVSKYGTTIKAHDRKTVRSIANDKAHEIVKARKAMKLPVKDKKSFENLYKQYVDKGKSIASYIQ